MRADASIRGLLAVIAASALVRAAVAFGVPIVYDEAHYWVWSRHLMWGYPDHPPVIAGLVAASTRLLGDSVAAIRFFPLLLGAASTAGIYALARCLFGPGAGLRAAVLFAVLPAFAVGGVMAFPDAPFAFFWLLAMLFTWKATRGAWWAWPAAGLAIGLAIQSKLAGGALALSLAGYVVATPRQWRWLRTPGPYIAALTGAGVLAPLIWWNLEHAWASVVRAGVIEPWVAPATPLASLAVYVGSQFLYYAPLGFAALIAGLAGSARRARGDERFGFLLWCAVPTLALMIAGSFPGWAKPHYTAPAMLAAAVATSGLWDTWKTRRWLQGAVMSSAAFTVLVFVLALVPNPALGVFQAEARNWPRIAREVESLLREQGPEGSVFVLAETYQSGSQLIYAMRNRAPVVVPFRGFDLWEPPEVWLGRNGVYVHDTSAPPKDRLPHAFARMGAPTVVPIAGDRAFLLYPGFGFRGLK